jgi:hypothetical protein
MGVRQAERTGVTTTPSTLLRLLMRLPSPVTRAVRILGVDDFGATRSYRCSRKDSSYGGSYLEFCLQCPARLNQERLGQCSRARKGGN